MSLKLKRNADSSRDSLVSSVLNYTSEMWGYNEGKDFEIIHTEFLGKILCVNKSAILIGLYGEWGRVPLFIMRKVYMFGYWIKLLQSNDNCVAKRVYSMLKFDADNNISYNKLNWAFHIKSISETLGLSNLSRDMINPPSLIRVFAVRMNKAWVLSYPLSAQRRLWSDLADAQADLSLRWAHSHFVGFVMPRLIYG